MVLPLIRLPFGQTPLSYGITFAINHAEKAALVVKAIYCNHYSHSALLLLIQMRIMKMPYDIAGVIRMFSGSCLLLLFIFVFIFITTEKYKNKKLQCYNCTLRIL